jgi:lactate dehydrogenase-like 2-hydroxyacid dehydrogenase
VRSGLRIAVTRRLPGIEPLGEVEGAVVDVQPHARELSHAELERFAEGADVLVCTLLDRIDRPLLERLTPRLRLVATFAVGYENIDVQAAADLSVRVTHTPGVLTDSTAEVAVALMLACGRRVAEGDRLVRAGRWKGFAPDFHLGHGLYGKRVGIVGAGRIGRRVALTLRQGFDCNLLVHSTSSHPDWQSDLDARFVELPELLKHSDFVSLHCPLTPETRHLIDAAALARMKPTAILVNTARGPVVDEHALAEALVAERIAAAGLDVYEDEPHIAPELLALENVVLLPHVGSATHETRTAMGRLCARSVVDVLAGREPAHPVV